MSNELDELRELSATITTALTTGELSSSATKSLALIPIRDSVLRFAYDNPELRQVMIDTLSAVDTSNFDSDVSATINTVLAGIIWFDGDKEATRANLDKALEADNTYSLARLLDLALAHGVPNSIWTQSISEVSPEQCLTGAE